MANLHSYLKKVLEEYGSEKNKSFGGNKFVKDIKTDVEDVIPNNLFPRDEYKIKFACGQGRWADVPWVAVFYKDLSTSAQEGYYIVYLFRADGTGVYLSLNQGYKHFKKLFKSKAKEKIEKVSKYWRAHLNFLSNKNDHGFIVDPIDLKHKKKSDLPEGYQLGNICSKFYSMDKFSSISNKELLKDLEYLKMMFTELRGLMSPNNFKYFNNKILDSVLTEDLEVRIIKKKS